MLAPSCRIKIQHRHANATEISDKASLRQIASIK
jgi:hypothetical protein